MRYAKVAMNCRSRYTLYVSVYFRKARVKAIYWLLVNLLIHLTYPGCDIHEKQLPLKGDCKVACEGEGNLKYTTSRFRIL